MKMRGTLLTLLQICIPSICRLRLIFYVTTYIQSVLDLNTNMGAIYLNLFSPISGTLGGIPVAIIAPF